MKAKWIVFYDRCFEDNWEERYDNFPYEKIDDVLNFLWKIDCDREYRGITLGLFIPSEQFNIDVNKLLREKGTLKSSSGLYEIFQKYFSNDF